MYETYGEDVHLASEMGEAYVSGHQGDGDSDFKSGRSALACLKHYIGYGYPFNGRDRTNAFIPDIQLREYHLPPFERGVAAGALTVMINSASVNGMPGHANAHYINDILKSELGFDGFVVSDWQDIVRLHTRDKLAATPEEAVRVAVMAGVDMSMVPRDYSFYDHCVALARKDTAFARRVDDASMRILKVKNKLGLFENPLPNPNDVGNVGRPDSVDFNLEAARESIILAKNQNNLLPLTTGLRLLVTGPTANSSSSLNGGWSHSWQGNETLIHMFGRKKYSVYEALVRDYSGEVVFQQGIYDTFFFSSSRFKLNKDFSIQGLN